MDVLFQDFSKAFASGSGPLLAATLSPVPPAHRESYLTEVWSSTNAHNVQHDIKRAIDSSPVRSRLDSDEVKGWVDVYTAYWKVVGDILAVRESVRVSEPASHPASQPASSVRGRCMWLVCLSRDGKLTN